MGRSASHLKGFFIVHMIVSDLHYLNAKAPKLIEIWAFCESECLIIIIIIVYKLTIVIVIIINFFFFK